MSHFPQAGTAFPTPQSVISYADGLHYVRHRLSAFPHGGLKPWAETQGMNYSMLVNLKNSQMTKQTPLLVQRILKAFGFDTEPIRVTQGGQQAYQFVFHAAEQLQAFRAQLLFFQPADSSPAAAPTT